MYAVVSVEILLSICQKIAVSTHVRPLTVPSLWNYVKLKKKSDTLNCISLFLYNSFNFRNNKKKTLSHTISKILLILFSNGHIHQTNFHCISKDTYIFMYSHTTLIILKEIRRKANNIVFLDVHIHIQHQQQQSIQFHKHIVTQCDLKINAHSLQHTLVSK